MLCKRCANNENQKVTCLWGRDLQSYTRVSRCFWQFIKKLAPHRFQDHSIILKEDTSLLNLKLHWYLNLQKDVIERLVQEMLNLGTIHSRFSHFSSLIILGKRKDNSWRIFIDYRVLNKHRIKEKYHISIIDELLDELKRIVVCSKLNIRLGITKLKCINLISLKLTSEHMSIKEYFCINKCYIYIL